MQYRPQFSLPLMGPSSPPGIVDPQSITRLTHQPSAFSLRPSLWQLLVPSYPLAPPGTHILIHDKPSARASLDTWYLGPAFHHHRCFCAWVWSTKTERITDTVTWLPKHVAIPTVTLQQTIHNSAQSIVDALQTTTSPSLVLTPFQSELVQRLNALLNSLRSPPPSSNIAGPLTSASDPTRSPTPPLAPTSLPVTYTAPDITPRLLRQF
jgi:hypothetical protein